MSFCRNETVPCVGLVNCVAPMVLSETTPHKYRGAFGTVHQLSVTIGIFLSSVFGLPQLMGWFHGPDVILLYKSINESVNQSINIRLMRGMSKRGPTHV